MNKTAYTCTTSAYPHVHHPLYASDKPFIAVVWKAGCERDKTMDGEKEPEEKHAIQLTNFVQPKDESG